MVPLANMFGYVNNLRSLSQGRANYSMQFDHYERVPLAVAVAVAGAVVVPVAVTVAVLMRPRPC